MLNVIIQSHSGCNKKRTRWIVATINPIPCRPCVHPSTFPKVLIHKFGSSKRREIIIFAHNYLKKNINKSSISSSWFSIKYIFPFIRTRHLKPIAINTHIDCPNNSKSSVRYILKATARSLESVLFEHFLLDKQSQPIWVELVDVLHLTSIESLSL